MDDVALRRFFMQQAGLVSRRQVLASGGDDKFIEKQLRRREWARVHTGVFVLHTGPLTWLERAWGGLLFCWPAALSHESALLAYGLRSMPSQMAATSVYGSSRTDRFSTAPTPVHIAVAANRRLVEPSGVRLHRVSDFAAALRANTSPPRLNLERSVLDVASDAARNSDAIAVLADACQTGRTTPARLVEALRARKRLRRRGFLLAVLDDVARGAYSVLEHRYLTEVERPHGLPTAQRQRRVRSGRTTAYRDVEYVGFSTVIELDGSVGHEQALDRWADMARDIDSSLSGEITLRIGWRHVEDSCRTAASVARLLTANGWTGHLRACSPECMFRRNVGGCSPLSGE